MRIIVEFQNNTWTAWFEDNSQLMVCGADPVAAVGRLWEVYLQAEEIAPHTVPLG